MRLIDMDDVLSIVNDLRDRMTVEEYCAMVERVKALATNLQSSNQDDLIRRSDALKCFHSWVDHYGDVHTPDEMVEYRAIEELPSVEPEIIRCRDCVKRETCRITNIWAVAPDDDWFCGDAERRIDDGE